MLTPEQLELRKTGVGASESPAVVGVSPYEGPLAVWCAKTGRAAPKPTSEQMDLGNELEELIIRRAMRQLGVKEVLYGSTKAHPEYPWLLATPDALIDAQSAIQAKNVGHRMLHHWSLDDDDDTGIPDYVNCQVQQEMFVWDLDVVYVSALLGGRTHRIYRVNRDREVGEAIAEVVTRFWHDYVLADVQPPVDGRWSTERWLQDRFTRTVDAPLVADATTEEMVAELRDVRRQQELAAKQRVLLEQRLKERMGEHTVLETSLGQITWRPDKWGRVAWKEACKAGGVPRDVVDRFRSPPGRRFSVPRAWGDGGDDE